MIAIDWFAFVQVFAAALLSAGTIVLFYALGLRLMVLSGRAPVVTPAEFTDAITVISEKEARRAAKAAAKAAKKNPLTDGQKRVALIGAYACFAVCAAAVLGGLLLIVFNH
ncbi:peptidase [Microbacterium hominis]|uniref:Peptidase n=1 Tax=Microbacterium hominis TaxID=162426 RepID=A0A7D4TG01_9MICO|nr:peptidase [Microbacterium hominis]QKJ19840.1 peptidase [Microbacterium hominis]